MIRPRLRALARLIAVIGTPLLLLTGCTLGDFHWSIGAGGSQIDERLPGVEKFTAQQVRWSSCGDGMQCAKVVAPLDWSLPDDRRRIEIAVTRHQATGERLGSLFMNPGGPGASGYTYVHDYWQYFFSPALAEHYDLVGWDPRGVGRTTPVTCYTDPDQIEDWLYDVPEADPRTDPEGYEAESKAAAKEYIDACEEGTGEAIGYVDTQSTVKDLDLLRAVVGDERLQYLGFSYGTDIGQQYLEAFPDRVGRMVLDGVTDPSLDLFHVVLEQQAGFEHALTNYLQQCPSRFGASCPFTADVAASKARIHDLVVRLNADPLPASQAGDDRRLTGDVVAQAISQALYDQGMWQDLNSMFAQLEARPVVTDTAFLLADEYYGFTPGEGYADNLMDAFTAINCLDYDLETDLAVIAAQDEQIRAAAPTTSDWWPPMVDPVCSQWPATADAPEPHPITGEGVTVPILVVSTTGDPATPYEWGVKVAQSLATGVLVTYNGEGHTAYGANAPACVVDAVDRYLLTGEAPAVDPQC